MARLFLQGAAIWAGSAVLLFVSVVIVAVLAGPTVRGGEQGVVVLLGVGLVVTVLSILAFARVAVPPLQGPSAIAAILLFTVAQLLLLPPYVLMLLLSLNR